MLPCIYLFSRQYLEFGKSKIKSFIYSFVVIFIQLLGFVFFTNYGIRVHKAYPEYKLMWLDVASTIKETGDNFLPPSITKHQDFKLDTILANYTPASFDDIYWSPFGTNVPPPTEKLNNDLKKVWVKSILNHPLNYIENRFKGFLFYLRIKHRYKKEEYWNSALWIDPNNSLGLNFVNNRVKNFAYYMFLFLTTINYFEPWFWLVCNFLLFIVFRRAFKNNNKLIYKVLIAIQLSAILYSFSHFFVYQHDRDFRYHYWNVFAVWICLPYLFGLWNEKKNTAKQNHSSISQ